MSKFLSCMEKLPLQNQDVQLAIVVNRDSEHPTVLVMAARFVLENSLLQFKTFTRYLLPRSKGMYWAPLESVEPEQLERPTVSYGDAAHVYPGCGMML